MKARLQKVLLVCVVGLGIGLAYGIYLHMGGPAIPCIFRLITGLQCPGCGITRMCLCLMRLDFAGAFAYHPVVLALLPLGLAVALDWIVVYIKTGNRVQRKWASIATYAMIVALVLFGIWRSLPVIFH